MKRIGKGKLQKIITIDEELNKIQDLLDARRVTNGEAGSLPTGNRL
ncbi:MAG: hypothetical protein PQJ59_04280 [Spirochaetales bacterium]|nr:hypothetical protein [Spirochaetales bacterium]